MSLTYSDWPFLGDDARTLADTERWWAECYLPIKGTTDLQGQPHWRIVKAGAGMGKSVALRALEKTVQGNALIVRCTLDDLSRSPHAPVKGKNQLAQFMNLAAAVITQHLIEHPDKTSALVMKQDETHHPNKLEPFSKTQLEFLRWLIQNFRDERAYVRFLDALPEAVGKELKKVKFKNVYATQTDNPDIDGQIQELVNLARRMQFDQILVVLDVDGVVSESGLADLKELLSWHALIKNKGLALVGAMNNQLAEKINLIKTARGLINLVTLNWSAEEIRTMAEKHLRAATGGTLERVEDLFESSLVTELEQLILAEYAALAPRGWIDLVRIGLGMRGVSGTPLGLGSALELKTTFFETCMPLRIDPNPSVRGVWRGPRFIEMDEAPYNFFRVLWKKQGQVTVFEDFRGLAKSKEYLNTLASRVRKELEPLRPQNIYLKNTRADGYFLEHFEP